MTAQAGTSAGISGWIPLLDFLEQTVDREEAAPLAQRIGVGTTVRRSDTSNAREVWQGVVTAAVRQARIEQMLVELSKVIGEADVMGFDAAKAECARRHIAVDVSASHPELGTVSKQLVAARTIAELASAAAACRAVVERVLASLEARSASAIPVLVATDARTQTEISERLSALAMNVLTVVDRMLDIADIATGDAATMLLQQQTPDDFGYAAAGQPNQSEQLSLARNARAAAWMHLQRLLRELNAATV